MTMTMMVTMKMMTMIMIPMRRRIIYNMLIIVMEEQGPWRFSGNLALEDLMIVKTMMVIMNMVRTNDNRFEPWVRIVMIKC